MQMDFHMSAIRPLHSAGDFDGDPGIDGARTNGINCGDMRGIRLRATGRLRKAARRGTNGARKKTPRRQQIRCNAARVTCHRKGRAVERNEAEIGIECGQVLGQELKSPWATARVETMLARPAAHETAS
jgi:hypothetical protein